MFLKRIGSLLVATACVASLAAEADPPTFQITSVFSNLDGSEQFIRLTETAGRNGQHRFAGLKLTIMRNDVRREYTFAHDLPGENTAYATVVVAAGSMPLQADLNFICCGAADYWMPQRFVPTDGGTIEFAGIDRISYAALPTDGFARYRDGTVGYALLPVSVCPTSLGPSFLGSICRNAASLQIAETTVRAVEYHNATLDHYFVTASAPDLDALDSGRIRGWQRTGVTFAVGATSLVSINWNVWDSPLPPAFPMQPVCRFYLPPESGDSHFYSASASECAQIQARYPSFVLESSAAFYAVLPDPGSGECPQGTGFFLTPVYRLWNGRADTNHRYTMSLADRNAMIAEGWVSEGYGPTGAAFCVPTGI